MTVATNDRRSGPTDGDGSTTVFVYDFPIEVDSDLEVWLLNETTLVETKQTLTTHYTVDGAGGVGTQEITFVTAPTANEKVLILGREPVNQTSDITGGDTVPLQTLQDIQDRLVRLEQQLQEVLDRTLRFTRFVDMAAEVGDGVQIPQPLAGDVNKKLAVSSITPIVLDWQT
ncbi:MAG: hypothetical protein ACE5HA_03310 [Anaerolineae bacterium]